jgi:hypothetical protein
MRLCDGRGLMRERRWRADKTVISRSSAAGKAALAAAPPAAKTNLQLQSIDNLLRSQRRF